MSASTRTDGPSPALVGPVVVWIALQMTALSLGAAGVRFSASYTEPADTESLQLMLVAQLAGATLLYRFICRTPGSAVVVAASAWPFLIAAGYLSATPIDRVAKVALYTSAWILIFGALAKRTVTPLPTTDAALACFVIGSPLLSYLALEFGESKFHDFGPISAVFRVLDGTATSWIVVGPAVLLAVAVVWRKSRIA